MVKRDDDNNFKSVMLPDNMTYYLVEEKPVHTWTLTRGMIVDGCDDPVLSHLLYCLKTEEFGLTSSLKITQ